ncbi:putative acetyltransferase (Partial match) [Frankia sp. AiPs1]|uniref:GNAT family N-acetyltransferase n=1 Tax=Frankia sp. AiPa1 TaxID=573492 RepID=UPI00202B5790|nr:GNAT family N-acetyltransferase [Frankia sp. AiPa1]MCL9758216.1 GNAT family N-acetyltransferase [Frankia sp. AiPa1]
MAGGEAEIISAVLEGFTVVSRLEVGPFRDDDDLDALRELDATIFGSLAYPYFVLRQVVDAHRDEILLARLDGKLCGYALTMTSRMSDVAWFQGLGVHPKYQGRHIGRRLACAALTKLFGAGIRTVQLVVRPANTAAVELYQSLDFQWQKDLPGYFGRGQDRMLMSCTLSKKLTRTLQAQARSDGEVRPAAVGPSPDRADAASTRG